MCAAHVCVCVCVRLAWQAYQSSTVESVEIGKSAKPQTHIHHFEDIRFGAQAIRCVILLSRRRRQQMGALCALPAVERIYRIPTRWSLKAYDTFWLLAFSPPFAVRPRSAIIRSLELCRKRPKRQNETTNCHKFVEHANCISVGLCVCVCVSASRHNTLVLYSSIVTPPQYQRTFIWVNDNSRAVHHTKAHKQTA